MNNTDEKQAKDLAQARIPCTSRTMQIIPVLVVLFLCWTTFFSSTLYAGTVRYIYDELGRLIGVIDEQGRLTEYVYDKVGNILSITRGTTNQVTILAFSPTHGEVGSTVTITGSGFGATPSQNTVRFAGTSASVTSATPSSITAVVPVGATSGPITVTTSSGSATSSKNFVVDTPQPPHIARFAPAIASPGQSLNISGENFRPGPANNQLQINTTTASVQSVTAPDVIIATTPTASGGKISVTTPFGSNTTTEDLYIVPAPFTPTEVGATGRITINQVPGRFVSINGGQIALVLFDAQSGVNDLHFSVANSSTSGTIKIYQPNGSAVGSALNFGTALSILNVPPLPSTGSYTALLSFDRGAGSATLSAWRDVSRAIALDTPTVVNIVDPRQQTNLTFNANQGEGFRLRLVNSTLPNALVQIFGPNGGQLARFTTDSNGAGDFGIRVNQTGNHRIQITPEGNGTGIATVMLSKWVDVSTTLVSGTPYALSIPNRAQQASLSFAATKDEGFSLRFTDSTLVDAAVNIFLPNGQQLSAGRAASDGSFNSSRRADQTGNYRAQVIPANNGTGNATVTMVRWVDVSATLVRGTPYSLSIPHDGQLANLTFIANKDEAFRLSIGASTLRNTTVRIYGPSGAEFAAAFSDANGALDFTGIRIPESGTYRIQIVPNNGGTATATLDAVVDVTTTLLSGVPYALRLPTPGQKANFFYTATKDEGFSLKFSDSTLANATVHVFRPNGILESTDTMAFGATYTLSKRAAETGTYRIQVIPPNSGTGNATVTITRWVDVSGTIVRGTPFALSIPNAGQQANLTFTAQNEGMRLRFTASTLTSAFVLITGPSGRLVGSAASAADGTIDDVFRTSEPGIHRVQVTPIFGSGNATVTLTGVVDVSAAIVKGTPYLLNIVEKGQIAKLTFAANQGDGLRLRIADSTLSAANVEVIGPSGAVSHIAFAGFDGKLDTTFRADATGNYRIEITPTQLIAGSATVVLTDASAVNATIVSGTPFRFTIGAGELANLGFAATQGDSFNLRITDSTLASATVQVIGPTGSLWHFAITGRDGSLNTNFHVFETGNHRIEVTPARGGAGSATVTLTLALPAETVLTPGTPYHLNLSSTTPSANLLFDARQGDGFTLNFANTTIGFSILSFHSPAGAEIGSALLAEGPSAYLRELPSSGRYRVNVDSLGTGFGSSDVTLTIWKDVTATININSLFALAIPQPSQRTLLIFDGTAGQNLGVEITASTFAPLGSVTVFASDGTAIGTGSLGQIDVDANGNPIPNRFNLPTLTSNDTFTIVIVPSNDEIGSAGIKVFTR